jgi:hypothetical protein
MGSTTQLARVQHMGIETPLYQSTLHGPRPPGINQAGDNLMYNPSLCQQPLFLE